MRIYSVVISIEATAVKVRWYVAKRELTEAAVLKRSLHVVLPRSSGTAQFIPNNAAPEMAFRPLAAREARKYNRDKPPAVSYDVEPVAQS